MNFLAHLALSCHDPELQMGNFLGDYTKGRPPANYPPRVLEGITLHRLIDKTTDAHPAVKAMAERLKPRHGRYAGVVTDIVFDYYLSRHWEELDLPPFSTFTSLTYRNLLANTAYLSPKLAARVKHMVADEWLNVYTTHAGILSVFRRMRPRFSQPEQLDGMAETLVLEDEAFNQSFLALFPDLRQTVNEFCGC